MKINPLGTFHAVSNHALLSAKLRNRETALQTSCIIKIHRAFMQEEPLKDLFQCYWWGCFLLFLIIDGSFSCRMSLYTCSMTQRKIHKALMSWRGATSPGSLFFGGGKENF